MIDRSEGNGSVILGSRRVYTGARGIKVLLVVAFLSVLCALSVCIGISILRSLFQTFPGNVKKISTWEFQTTIERAVCVVRCAPRGSPVLILGGFGCSPDPFSP